MKSIILMTLFTMSFSTFASTKFSNESEVSLIQTGGNSSVETYNAKTLSKWAKEKRTYSFGGHYTLGTAEQTDETTGDSQKVESARNWDVMGKYEQILSGKLSGYFSVQYEGDKFSGINQRENLDLGAKYTITNTDKTQSFAELGARYTIEKRTEEDEEGEDTFNFTKARIYYEIAHKKSESLSYKFWFEYLPNFTESEDYIITYEPSIAYVLTSTFSLKTAYRAVYDNVPNVEGFENTDYTFTTSLLAKF